MIHLDVNGQQLATSSQNYLILNANIINGDKKYSKY